MWSPSSTVRSSLLHHYARICFLKRHFRPGLAWVEDTAMSAKIPSWSFLETILGKQELLLVFSNLAGAWTCESGVGWACEPRYAIFIPVCHTLTLIPAGADSTIIWSAAELSGISRVAARFMFHRINQMNHQGTRSFTKVSCEDFLRAPSCL